MGYVKRYTKPSKPAAPPMPMVAPNWDDPKVQFDRIVKRSQQPRRIVKGPSGIKKGS